MFQASPRIVSAYKNSSTAAKSFRMALGAIRDEEAMVEFMENEVRVGADAANGLTKTAILPAGPPPRPNGRDSEGTPKGGPLLFEIGRDQSVLRPW